MNEKILNRIKAEYPSGYIIFSPQLVKALKVILKEYRIAEDLVMQITERVLTSALKSDDSIGFKGGRFSHNYPEPF